MDPNDLRDCVEREIRELIEPVAWQRCEIVNKAEQESLKTILEKWGRAMTAAAINKGRFTSAGKTQAVPIMTAALHNALAFARRGFAVLPLCWPIENTAG